MKYMLLLVRDDAEWEALGEDGRDMASIMEFWAGLAQEGKVLGGNQLQPSNTATTVSWEDGAPVVTDGPFIEAKETVAGFGIIDVADRDEAVAIAKRWPGKFHKVEVRPLAD